MVQKKTSHRTERREPRLLPRRGSPVEKAEGELLMKLRVPSLKIKRLGGFCLLVEKQLSAFGVLMERSEDSISITKAFTQPEARRVAITCGQKRNGKFRGRE
jgi:hypothetical protein